jgi:hypothetical protein
LFKWQDSSMNFILSILKFMIVDSTVNILGDLFEQPLVMWAFIGWGWIAVLVMVSSLITSVLAM